MYLARAVINGLKSGSKSGSVVPGEVAPVFGSKPAFYDESKGTYILNGQPVDSQYSDGSNGWSGGLFSGSPFSNALDLAKAAIDGLNSGSKSGSGTQAAAPSARSVDYLNADLAKHYGMSGETAYQESLSNTAYQRAVKDMQAAGLNPASLFGSGNGSYAQGVSYVSTPGYSGSGSAKSNNKLFDSGLYNIIQLAGGAIGAKVTGSSSGYYMGSSVARTLMSALDGIF